MKTKTASVRLPKEMYEEIDNICDSVGCSRNDWIKDTLQDKLREENSQDQEENSSGPDRNTTPKPKLEPILDNEPFNPTPRLKVELIDVPESFIINNHKLFHKVEKPNGNIEWIPYGDVKDFRLENKKVYFKNGKFIGNIDHNISKPQKVTI